MNKLLEIDCCYMCRWINGYYSHCIYKKVLFRKFDDSNIFYEIPDWCPLPDVKEKEK